MITVNSRKYDGTVKRSWKCEMLDQRDSLLVFVGEFDLAVEHPDLGNIRKGTVSYEYYWLDRWYNVFRFHEPTGELRNYYFNINIPPTFENGILDYVDLDIDVLVRPDFSCVVLDREEYESNAARFGYAAELRTRVDETLDEVLKSIESRNMPDLPELFCNIDVGAA